MRASLLSALGAVAALIALSCGGAASKGPATPSEPQVVEMEELRITAKPSEQGGYAFEVYDAPDLFDRATKLLNQGRCEQAVVLYDKLAQEFLSSPYASAALYNAGLCLQDTGRFEEAAERYTRLCESLPDSPDVTHASFQLVQVLLDLKRWEQAAVKAEQLLASEQLSSEERLEAMAQRAAALLGAERLQDAERIARGSLTYYRTRPTDQAIRDEMFAAQANFVLAETLRLRGQGMTLPTDGLEEQRQVLIRRAELLLDAQREYFNTIHLKNPRWAAASGYRIGHMYDELWEAVMNVPVPKHLASEGHDIYRIELAKLIKPLLRHAIRYWELTLMLIERTGIRSEWTEQTKKDLERVRNRLLEQPPGPGGLPSQPGAQQGEQQPPARPGGVATETEVEQRERQQPPGPGGAASEGEIQHVERQQPPGPGGAASEGETEQGDASQVPHKGVSR